MQIRPAPLAIVLVTVIFSPMVFTLLDTTRGTATPEFPPPVANVMEEARIELESAFRVVREAEAAEADQHELRILADRLNLVIQTVGEAQDLLPTYVDEARAQLNRSIELSRQIRADAVVLRDEAILTSSYRKTVIAGSVIAAALLMTLAVHFGTRMWLRAAVKGVMQARIKPRKCEEAD